MTEDYYIDLSQIDLERFKHMLETKDLLPGRRMLTEQIEKRFEMLKSMGINNLKELNEALKTKNRVGQLADESGISEKYLVILRREVNSYIPKPVYLNKIQDIETEYIDRLVSAGIKTTKDLFDRTKTKHQRAELSEKTNIPSEFILKLVKLSDLARIVGVGPVFARILYEAGVESIEAFVNQTPEAVLDQIQSVNESKRYTRVILKEKDIAYCLETANLLPQVVEYE